MRVTRYFIRSFQVVISAWQAATQKDREFLDNEHPIGRIGQPEEVAKAVMYFASDDASWTTGAILAVDGGESIK